MLTIHDNQIVGQDSTTETRSLGLLPAPGPQHFDGAALIARAAPSARLEI